ncbi:MAG TPA: hypothetical protein PKY81_05480 [bacterium]|nr:hypothetical protein [bacterium]
MIEYIPLTREIMEANINDFVAIDKFYCDSLGEKFTTFKWEKNNFLFDLYGKWELSFAAFSEKKLCGYIIASNTVIENCHIHRVAVKPEYKGKKFLVIYLINCLMPQKISA